MEYKTFGEGDRTYVRAQQAWIILTSYVQFGLDHDECGKGMITYGSLGKLMGFEGQITGRLAIKPVRHIFRFCKANELPLISAMVVRKDTGFPGWDYDIPNEKAFRMVQEKVLAYNWFSIRPPSSATFKNYPLDDSLHENF